ncbi:MAG: redoxin family protein [Bacteroidota bacterium]
MNKSILTGIIALQIIALLGIAGTAYFTHMNKARIQATQRVMVDTQMRLASTFAFMDDVQSKKFEREEARKPLAVGTLAPDFSLTDENNEEVNLDDFKGNKTLLVFSKEGCPYCQDYYPVLNEFQSQKSDVNIVVMQLGSEPEQNKQFKKQQGIEVPLLAASVDELKAYKIRGTPTSILLDEEGKILGSKVVSKLDELVEFVEESCTNCTVDS